MADSAELYLTVAMENERTRQLIAAEQAKQISDASTIATYGRSPSAANSAAFMAAIQSATTTQVASVATAHAAVSAVQAKTAVRIAATAPKGK